MTTRVHPFTTAAVMLAMCFIPGGAAAQTNPGAVTPTSKFFAINSFYYFDANGDYHPYSVSGFGEPIGGQAPRLFILPTMTLRKGSARFFDDSGNLFDPVLAPSRHVASAAVAIDFAQDLPNAQQLLGIGAALSGTSLRGAMDDLSTDTAGNPVIYGPAAAVPPIRASILQANQAYAQATGQQRDLAQRYAAFQPEQVTLTGMAATLQIGGDDVATTAFPGAALVGNDLRPEIYLKNPTTSQATMLRGGNYAVVVTFGFADSRYSFIDATIDAGATIRDYLKQTQTAVTSNRSSGFSVFGLGYRRSKLKQKISSTLESTSRSTRWSNTRIFMSDPDDQMMEQFEAAFFPQSNAQEVISNHFAAAERASADGNPALAKAHMDYVTALKADQPSSQIDAVAAAAALASGNYAMFLAQGVRASYTDNTANSSFTRIISNQVDIDQKTEWAVTKRYTVERQVAVPLREQTPKAQPARMGVCDVRMAPYNIWEAAYAPPAVMTPRGPMRQVFGQAPAVACIFQTGGASRAGLLPGMILWSIGGSRVKTLADVKEAVDQLTPGEDVEVQTIDYEAQPFVDQLSTFTVKVSAGVPVG